MGMDLRDPFEEESNTEGTLMANNSNKVCVVKVSSHTEEHLFVTLSNTKRLQLCNVFALAVTKIPTFGW